MGQRSLLDQADRVLLESREIFARTQQALRNLERSWSRVDPGLRAEVTPRAPRRWPPMGRLADRAKQEEIETLLAWNAEWIAQSSRLITLSREKIAGSRRRLARHD